MPEFTGRRRKVAVAATAAALAAVVAGASISSTLALRNTSQFAVTQFNVTVQPALELEGSVDGATWGETTTLSFTPDQMALQVGEENAVYSPLLVRAGKGTNTGASATVRETGLGASDFAGSLRGQIFEGVATCDADGVGATPLITTGTTLAGQSSNPFNIAVPAPIGEVGATTELCVKVWMNDNNWLLGGTTPPTETATWTVTGNSQ